jgi:Rieske Fe-S protein
VETTGAAAADRREVLRWGVTAAALTAGLSGCASEPETAQPGLSADGVVQASIGGGTAAADSGSSGLSSDVETTPLASLTDLQVGASLVVGGGDAKVVALTRVSESKVVAFTGVCTHQGCQVVAGVGVFTCPCHHSAFDAVTGAAAKGPATQPLSALAVRVRDNQIYPG